MTDTHNGKGWISTTWGKLARLEYGKGLRDYTKDQSTEKPYRVFGTNGPIGWHSAPLSYGPSIVVGRKGAYRGIHYAADPFFVIDTAFHLRPIDEFDMRWAYYQLKDYDINKLDSGSAIPSTSRDAFYEIPVALPPRPIQRRIAGILSAYDDLIENSQRRIKILEEMARRLYREWFVYFRFPGHEDCRFVDSPLGEIPEGWEAGRLDDVLVLQRGFDLPKSQRVDGQVPIYAATGVTGFHDTAMVMAPGVVTGRSGSIGEVVYVHEDFWPLNTALWVKEFPRSEPLYAYFLLASLDLKQFNSGAAVPTLNRNDIHGLSVLIPPRGLQQNFQRVAGALLLQARTHSLQIENLRRTRDLLLPRLLSGQIDVEALPEPVLSES